MNPDLSIVLVGNTGVGKSASGNTILGWSAFESKLSFKPVTKEICEKMGQVFGKNISVIDTPGILGSEQVIKMHCEDLLQSDIPVLFLVVIRVGQFSKEDQEAVEAAISVVGPEGFRKTYLLFTGGDVLKNMLLDDFMHQDEGSLNNTIKKFEDRYHLFNNQQGGHEQVQELLHKSGHSQTLEPLAASPAVCIDPPHLEERRIVLMGLPGGGKSSSGNTILGSERFKSVCSFHSVSTETVSQSVEVEGRQLTVVDTPGFTNEALTPEELYLEIMKTFTEASPGPHAFVLVVRIGQTSEADKKLFELLPKLFGGNASKYTVVLFTHGDELKGQSMDDLIQSSKCVSDLVFMCSGRFYVFENTKRENRLQVREFLRKIDEMVAANGGEHYTSDMFRMAETSIREAKKQPLNKSAGAFEDLKEAAWKIFSKKVKDNWKKFSALFIDWYKTRLHNPEACEMIPLCDQER